MTNYEKYKDKIDAIFDANTYIAIDKNTNKITHCHTQRCSDCLFSERYNQGIFCNVTVAKWLLSKYVEPEVDWSKVPVDTPVLVSLDEKEWSRRYFAGVDKDGSPMAFDCGATQWSSEGETFRVRHIKLAEVLDE